MQRSEGEVKAKALTALARKREVKVTRGLDQPAEDRLWVGSSSFTDVVKIQGKVRYLSAPVFADHVLMFRVSRWRPLAVLEL